MRGGWVVDMVGMTMGRVRWRHMSIVGHGRAGPE